MIVDISQSCFSYIFNNVLLEESFGQVQDSTKLIEIEIRECERLSWKTGVATNCC